jgi:hypothetical protein
LDRDALVKVLQRHGLCGCDPFRAADRPHRAEQPKKLKRAP